MSDRPVTSAGDRAGMIEAFILDVDIVGNAVKPRSGDGGEEQKAGRDVISGYLRRSGDSDGVSEIFDFEKQADGSSPVCGGPQGACVVEIDRIVRLFG